MSSASFFVIKSDELIALNYLSGTCPVPVSVEWIERSTDRHLSPSRIEQLLRTYHRKDASPGVVKLRENAGIRAHFGSEHERNLFARAIADACKKAEADSIPELEVSENDVVGCGHGTANGPVDEEQMFYLKTRGFNEAEGRSVLISAFLNATLSAMGSQAVHDHLLEILSEDLDAIA